MTQKLDIDDKYPGLRESLGQESDAVLAARYQISAARIGQIRNSLDIAPATKRATAQGTFVNEVFRNLRDRWKATVSAKGKPDTMPALAGALGIKKAGRLSEWSTGSQGRRPSWDVLVNLAALSKCSLTLDKSGVMIQGARRKDTDRVLRGAGESF